RIPPGGRGEPAATGSLRPVAPEQAHASIIRMVRQRIARCAALLAADLDDPDTRMELWFALRHT
ncbi:helix-turn-helix domain-containing protein, partial [Streptomyces sp. NPDC007070]|uniref:helix-turn-helix domain-containing protein n=1 Tax=Streptomyces sp. NPDC007070 TaxID=3154312 RepID=UPI0033BFCBA5